MRATGKPDLIRGIRRGAEPGINKVVALARVLECGVSWLATGQDEPGAVPVIGMAECGLRGWYQESPTGLLAQAPAAVAADPSGLAVVAVGNSMRPAGIRPGDLVFCQSGPPPEEGDAVMVELVGGTVALKRWGGRSGDWVTLLGWLDAEGGENGGGVQMPYQDRRRIDQVARVLRVALVQPGTFGQPAAPVAHDDRLYEVAIRTTLRWYESQGLEVAPDALAAMVTKAVLLVRSRTATADKTEIELADEIRAILDVAREMAASSGWSGGRA